jgi:hypothetical protein
MRVGVKPTNLIEETSDAAEMLEEAVAHLKRELRRRRS